MSGRNSTLISPALGGGFIRIHMVAGLALLIALFAVAGQAFADEYVVDSARSELAVRLFKGGIAAALAHNHVIRAIGFTGSARLDADTPANSFISIDVQTASLRADEPNVREKYGLIEPMKAQDRAKIQETMESAAQMNVAEYPTMRFQSTRIEKQSESDLLVTGDLTMHGVTRPVSFPVTVETVGDALRGKASLKFKQSDFGIKPYSAFLGAVRNEDEAMMYLDIVAIPAPKP
ncbi:MAG: YceI family protein [Candidatus Abyssobacteria bacterium SURF_17]|uniref:YceI family protein n=1 Tax=Candidatus Abyssobacteria bacterium SURF_17 TaxID=2093361 RepID=A0A419EY13_9BACT|nr:MAG: YceI family protein [Candidatus Abyssubacteria bacterium SURF_17]